MIPGYGRGAVNMIAPLLFYVIPKTAFTRAGARKEKQILIGNDNHNQLLRP
jgi:hypothetical protein